MDARGPARRIVLLLLVAALLATAVAGTPAWADKPPDGPLPRRPVIFVHGYCGNAECWGEGSAIPARLVTEYGYDRDDLHFFVYPPGPICGEDSKGDIRVIAQELGREIDRLRDGGQVDVVAHSMGAVVARYYMAHFMDRDHPTIAHFISVAGANNGSFWMAGYEIPTQALAQAFDAWLEEQIRLLIGLPIPIPDRWTRIMLEGAFNAVLDKVMARFCSKPAEEECNRCGGWCCFLDPDSTAATQLVPKPWGEFLTDLNQPGNTPDRVDYTTIYGNFRLTVKLDLFGIPWKMGPFRLGDGVVGAGSASEIPGRTTGDPDYRTIEVATDLEANLRLKLTWSSFTVEAMAALSGYPPDETVHGGLVRSDDVTREVDRILRGDYDRVTPPPITPPPANAGTATVLVMDVSGSMGDYWQDGVKIVSAVEAAGRIVRRVQDENRVSGDVHRMALVSFSDYAQVDVPMGFDLDAILASLNGYFPLFSTNIGHAMELANSELVSISPGVSKIIIFLTDGQITLGMNEEQVLAGPVAEAVQAGTCIYTIGFGDPGDLDEGFLREMAARSGCGAYYYAPNAGELTEIYVRLRHVSAGTLLGEYSGSVSQGQRVEVGEVEVPAGQSELHVTLDWPGSTLDLLLTDPAGRVVDEGYPGAQIFPEAVSAYILVQNPAAGRWRIGVYGRDVPTGTTTYYAAASVRGGAASGTPLGLVLGLVGGGLVVGVVVIVAVTRRVRAVAPAVAALYVIGGSAARRSLSLGQGAYALGRDPRSSMVFLDPQVSRQHAQVAFSGGVFYIADLGSANGTWVNQVRLVPRQWQALRDGDIIRLGDTLVQFRQAGGKA